MKRVLVDTDVCLDLLTGREPFTEEAYRFFAAMEARAWVSCVTAGSFLDLHYFLKKKFGGQVAREVLEKFKTEVEILPVDVKALVAALRSEVVDFEDAVQIEVASASKIDCIVTRNIKDYKYSKVKALMPGEFLAQ